jgi:type IV pilus assembly protein PilQ
MKRLIEGLLVVFFVLAVLLPGGNAADPAVLEGITFDHPTGKERVNILVSKPASFTVEERDGNIVRIRLEGASVPDKLKRTHGAGELDNIKSIVADGKGSGSRSWVAVDVSLKERVPFVVRQSSRSILVDFNVTTLALAKPAAPVVKPSVPVVKPSASTKTPVVSSKALLLGQAPAETKPVQVAKSYDLDAADGEKAKYTGQRISIDFQDANIRSVFRLLSEVSGKNIVSAEDIKGSVTITLKNVPWDQALDTILSLNSLTKRESGDVISIITQDKLKKETADRKAIEDEQRKSELARKEEEQKQLVEKGRLRQVSIEAKIIETTDSFIRNLGVQWAAGGTGLGGANSYPYGAAGGTNPSLLNSLVTTPPTGIGLTSEALAVNFLPMASTITSPTLGIVLGSSKAVLDVQLAASETISETRIISSPKITTMDNVKAIIKQGEDVPYVTPASSTSPATVSFKEAVLKLEVKPRLTPDGKISMEIKASNDYADYARAASLQNNPPINKSEIESTVVVRDGDTIVIGGIMKTTDTEAVTGVPWIHKIPVLGWLFKTEDITKKKTQLLIFVTPKIINSTDTAVFAEPALTSAEG